MLGALRQVARYRLHRRGPPAPLPPNARILAIQPDNLGGMLLTTPALRLLKAALPECELTVMAGPWAADVAAHCPVVDRVEVCPFPGFAPAGGAAPGAPRGGGLGPWRLLLEQAAGLSGEGFHLALNLPSRLLLGRRPGRVGRGAVPAGLPLPGRGPLPLPHAAPPAAPGGRAPPAPAAGRTWPSWGWPWPGKRFPSPDSSPRVLPTCEPSTSRPRRAGRGGAPLAGPRFGPGAGGDRHPSCPGGAGEALDGAALRHRGRPLRRTLRGPHRAHGGPGRRGGGPRRRPAQPHPSGAPGGADLLRGPRRPARALPLGGGNGQRGPAPGDGAGRAHGAPLRPRRSRRLGGLDRPGRRL